MVLLDEQQEGLRNLARRQSLDVRRRALEDRAQRDVVVRHRRRTEALREVVRKDEHCRVADHRRRVAEAAATAEVQVRKERPSAVAVADGTRVAAACAVPRGTLDHACEAEQTFPEV